MYTNFELNPFIFIEVLYVYNVNNESSTYKGSTRTSRFGFAPNFFLWVIYDLK